MFALRLGTVKLIELINVDLASGAFLFVVAISRILDRRNAGRQKQDHRGRTEVAF